MGVDVSFEFLGDGLAYGFPEKERPPEVEALQLEALKALLRLAPSQWLGHGGCRRSSAARTCTTLPYLLTRWFTKLQLRRCGLRQPSKVLQHATAFRSKHWDYGCIYLGTVDRLVRQTQ